MNDDYFWMPDQTCLSSRQVRHDGTAVVILNLIQNPEKENRKRKEYDDRSGRRIASILHGKRVRYGWK